MAESIVSRITGPVVVATGLEGAQMYDVVRIGELGLVGEIIRLEGSKATVQVYEDTTGLRPGEKLINTKRPLSIQLGPGLLTSIYDGIQRPLNILREQSGDFIGRGKTIPALDQEKKWEFIPVKKRGDDVFQGEIIGEVKETPLIKHRIMMPSATQGKLEEINEGRYTVNEIVATVKTPSTKVDIGLSSWWTVRTPRPVLRKLPPESPLLPGQRVLDTFFPVAKGGTAAIPGPFGSGKTVTQQQLAKWADSNVIVYVGCGERGNEMTEVLTTFPELEDPKSKRPLMERTILVANTSNMPVAAREASIYTGVTMAEYYRDMGYDVVLVADSTSRWAEALREMSGRLEEMPAEEGYPSYLASRLAEFYERAGRIRALGSPDRSGSVTIVGAVSPSGADFTEPVTTHTIRFIKTFWALDTRLAYSRHYPSINWMNSYSGYLEDVSKWWKQNISPEWYDLRAESYHILQREDTLKEIVRLIGTEALPDEEKLVLEVARMIKIGILQQNSFDKVDTYCSPEKQLKLVRLMVTFYKESQKALKEGKSLADIRALPIITTLLRAKFEVSDE